MIKVAFCDDDVSVLGEVSALVDQYRVERNQEIGYAAFKSPLELLAEVERGMRFDILFLDVIMPGQNGISAAKEIRKYDSSVKIIFLTSSREYAVDSYDVKAFHYLMKPLESDHLFRVLDDFWETTHTARESFAAQTDTGFCRITLEDVDYLEAQNKRVLVSLSNDTDIEIRELFSKCEEIFSLEKGFFKCHRSYIVNLNHVEQFTKTQISTKNGTNIPISRNNYAAFKEAYFSYMFR